MLRNFSNIRPDERRDTWVAFAILFGLIASHSMLETARDALFLAKLPASKLPWVYLAIAGVSLVVTAGQNRLAQRLSGRTALSVWIGFAGLITLAFWFIGKGSGTAGLYALYIWSGVLTMLVLVHFWTLLGDLFNVTQAKRVYAVIGSGSVLGAIVGSAMAGMLVRMMPATELLLASGAGFLFTAILPMALRSIQHDKPQQEQTRSSLLEAASYVARRPYARQVVLLMIISAITVTVSDYIFKATVAELVPADELGAFFASVYLVLNVASLAVQLTALTWIVRRFDIAAALAVLPLLLLGGGAIFVASAGLTAALIIKGADGSLRYSLHRTATELLFVPLSDSARRRIKSFIDIVGQRGGQAFASVLILSGAALGLGLRFYAIALVLCATTWILVAIGLRPYYLDLFRGRLDRDLTNNTEFPELDVASLETIIASLDSRDERAVVAALRMIESEQKVQLIPSLILYHPSEEVVECALEIFARNGRSKSLELTKRLLTDHPSPRIRSAAVASISAISSSEQFLRMQLSTEDSAEVRAVITVNLIAQGSISGSDARDSLDAIIRSGTVEARVALGEAIGRQGGPETCAVLSELATANSPEVRAAAAHAMGQQKLETSLPTLLELLTNEETRGTARESLLQFGSKGLKAIADALEDPATSRLVRWELPKALGMYRTEEAAAVLLRSLPGQSDGMVRYRSIRALEGIIAAQPMLRLDRETLDQSIDATVARCYRYLDRRVSLESGVADDPSRRSPGCELLLKMLEDKEAHAFDRLFRLLNLARPKDEFLKIFRSFRSDRPEARAGSLELIENLIKPPLRSAIVGLVDDVPDADRLDHAGQYHQPLRLSYYELLSSMLNSSSKDVRDITIFHIGELRLTNFEPAVARLNVSNDGHSGDIERTLAILRQPPEHGDESNAP